MESLLDTCVLDKENFEGAIAVGLKPRDMLVMFSKTGREMDEWCRENYGIPQFETVYEICKQKVIYDYLGFVKELGLRGNVSALNIIDGVLRGANEDKTVKIVFSGEMEKETEHDKENS